MGDNQKYQQQFATYINAGHEADGLEELYESVHEKIREDPTPSEKKSFTPDKSYKRKAKISIEEYKAKIQEKKDAKKLSSKNLMRSNFILNINHWLCLLLSFQQILYLYALCIKIKTFSFRLVHIFSKWF